MYRNSHLLTYNLHWDQGLSWSAQILHYFLLQEVTFLLFFFSLFHGDAIYFTVTSILPQVTHSLSCHPPHLLSYFSTTQSFLVMGRWKEKGATAPRRGKRKTKSLYFHARTSALAKASIAEVAGEEKDKVKGRRKKGDGKVATARSFQ